MCEVGNIGELSSEVIADAEFYIDRCTFIVVVFDLSFGKSGFVVRAPVDRLKSLIDVALFEHFAENAHLSGFKGGSHCGVGMLPVSADAETDKFLSLAVNIVLRKLMAGIAELGDRHFLAVELVLLDYRALNGHTVVVPAGNIGGIVSLH